jgi:aminoglycoside phosphotransferase (APT) family kinase protein
MKGKQSLGVESYPFEIQQALAPITSSFPPAHQGLASFVTFAETGMGPVVIKRADGYRLQALRRERQVLELLRGSGLPVPEVFLFAEVEKAGAPQGWLVMRRLPGEPLEQALLATGPSSTSADLLNKLGKIVARLHTLPIPPALAGERARWLDDMLDLAETNLPLGLWQGSFTDLDGLRKQRPAPVGPKFIHGDLFLDNVITDGNEITGIVDWAFGAAGDPRYDLAVAMDELSNPDQQAFLHGYGLPDGLSAFETAYFRRLALFC